MIRPLQNERMLFLIKLIHTIIWALFVCVIGYILYAGIFDVLDHWVVLAMGMILLEGLVLRLNHGSCPLTPLAARYTNLRHESFDIFLPNWLAKHNKLIFGALALCGAVLVLLRWLT